MKNSVLNTSQRKGPWNSFPSGKYKGRTILDIIEEDPQYIIWCCMEFLNLTPVQARYLGDKYGKEVPDRYISQVKSSKESDDIISLADWKWIRQFNSIPYEVLLENFEADSPYEKNIQLQKNR